ncbi:Zn(2+)-responsive transcriptional regulator [Marinomonas sp. C2222]|uniref:Zn(2+)-responsive transcriptional regulator n=1 Tax=Marinomonas sargassi TaxID=2984494 RepID=A0ABT2YRZ6_9GAMM|nr:Zn(2+)-responsive transcriptional regulator [Marinomonas sargassi]MCV2402530.1 Zn(2+)-responsive transcriptional regulator [Marinomonas sargassi]
MKIGQLAKSSGISSSTLRYYEQQGLIQASSRSGSNYRQYTEQDLSTAKFIKRCRDTGFSLEEVSELLSIRADKANYVCEDAKQIAEQKILDVESKIQQMQQLLNTLHQLSDACCGGVESAEFCRILDTLEADSSANKENNQ